MVCSISPQVPSQRKAIRRSVMNLANNLMDQHYPGYDEEEEGEGERLVYTPESVGYHLEEYTPQVNMQVTQSTAIPDRRHTSSPLSAVLRKPPTPRALGERDPDHLPHSGQVHEMSKKFLKKSSSNSPQRSRGSRKNVHHVPIVVGNGDQGPSVYSHNSPKPSPHRPVNRPLSWDSPHVSDNVPVIESERGDSLPPPSLNEDSESIGFRRHSNARTPFRQKPPVSPTPSSQETPVPQEEDEIEADLRETPRRPSFQSQISEESMRNPTKVLDEILEQYDPETQQKPIAKMSVKARTQLWEMKAYAGFTQTLPRSFKQRTKSTPCSPLKTPNSDGQEAPRTPTSANSKHFNFFNSPGDLIRSVIKISLFFNINVSFQR